MAERPAETSLVPVMVRESFSPASPAGSALSILVDPFVLVADAGVRLVNRTLGVRASLLAENYRSTVTAARYRRVFSVLRPSL